MTMHRAFVGSGSSGSSAADGAIHLLTMTAGRAELTSCFTDLSCNPTYLALHPGRHTLYGVDQVESGRVFAWRVDPQRPERLEQLGESQSSGGNGPCHLLVHEDSRHVLVANYVDGSVTSLPILADGSLGRPTDIVPGHDASHAHMAATDADRGQVLVADLGTDQINRYQLDNGTFEPIGTLRVHAGGGPRHLVIRENLAYIACERDSTVSVVDLSANAEIAIVPTLRLPSTETSYPSAIRMSADGRFLYVANRGPDTVARLSVRGAEVIRLDDAPTGGEHPHDLVLTPDGTHLVVANQISGDLSIRAIAGAGSPGEKLQTIQLPRASCIAWI